MIKCCMNGSSYNIYIYGTEIFLDNHMYVSIVARHYIGSTIPSLATRLDIVILHEGYDGSSETVK